MHSKLIQSLSYFWGFTADRYHCFIAQSEPDQQQCLAIRHLALDDSYSKTTYNPGKLDELDKHSLIIACRDTRTDQIVGCCRITLAQTANQSPEFRRYHKLGNFSESMLQDVLVTSRLAVLKEYRKMAVRSALATAVYEYALKHHYTVGLVLCEPQFYKAYQKLGYHPLDKFSASHHGGSRIPLFLIHHDFKYLQKQQSPLHRTAKKQRFPMRLSGVNWYHSVYLREEKNNVHSLAVNSESSDSKSTSIESLPLVEGLSDIAQYNLKMNSVEVFCQPGEQVTKTGMTDRYIGFIKSGSIDVVVNNIVVHTIQEGELFGEISCLLSINRNASLITRSQTDMVLFNYECINQLGSAEDVATFWKNISKALANKLLNINHRFRVAYDMPREYSEKASTYP